MTENKEVSEEIVDLHTKLLQPNANLTNFYYYRNGLSKEKIQRIIDMVPPNELYDGNVSGTIDKTYRSSRIYWIRKTAENMWLYNELMYFIVDANKNMWNFDLTCLKEDIQFTEYDADYQGHYDWHMDVGGPHSSTRKLSISVQLSDPSEYEGGELQFMIHRNVSSPDRSLGNVIVFPSFLLHRVQPLTKGRRRALVLWVHGPPYR